MKKPKNQKKDRPDIVSNFVFWRLPELIYISKTMIAKTPSPPYYAVIFSSVRTEGDNGYSEMSERMVDLASKQDGFLGMETARAGMGITVSYWRDLDSIKKWRENIDHSVARRKGRSDWYKCFKTRIARVERDYAFEKD